MKKILFPSFKLISKSKKDNDIKVKIIKFKIKYISLSLSNLFEFYNHFNIKKIYKEKIYLYRLNFQIIID